MRMQIGARLFDGPGPFVMGIVNATPDSFSDGGRFLDPSAAIAHALRLAEEGADLVDVGGESTRPGAPRVRGRRGDPARRPGHRGAARARVRAAHLDRHDEGRGRARRARGRRRPRERRRRPRRSRARAGRRAARGCRSSSCTRAALRRTCSRGRPTATSRPRFGPSWPRRCSAPRRRASRRSGPSSIRASASRRPPSRTSSSSPASASCALGRPLLVGPSRKSFIGKVAGAPVADRLPGTLAAVTAAVLAGAEIVRVHDVAAARQAALVAAEIRGAARAW